MRVLRPSMSVLRLSIKSPKMTPYSSIWENSANNPTPEKTIPIKEKINIT